MTDEGGRILRVRCPAKINLMLRVLRRREDGYHELDTVFQTIDLWDEIDYRPADALTLACDDPKVPGDESNLVLRAARLLARHAGVEHPTGALRLRKSIPAQAGLGGGSSDAAGALLLCARAWELRVAPSELQAIAAELGADVPFFLVGGTARGRGRGDIVTPLEPLAETPLVLGFPPYGLSTADIFGRLATRLTLPGNGVSLPRFFAHKWPQEKDFPLAVNDLEGVVFDGWSELAGFRDALLEAGATRAMLSGSGSTVFGVFPEDGERDEALRKLDAGFAEWTVLGSKTVDAAAGLIC